VRGPGDGGLRSPVAGPPRRVYWWHHSAFNPPDWHSHSTALHSAVDSGNVEAMRLLAAAGADLTIEGTLFHSTPRGWAIHLLGSDPFV